MFRQRSDILAERVSFISAGTAFRSSRQRDLAAAVVDSRRGVWAVLGGLLLAALDAPEACVGGVASLERGWKISADLCARVPVTVIFPHIC